MGRFAKWEDICWADSFFLDKPSEMRNIEWAKDALDGFRCIKVGGSFICVRF